MTSRPVASTTAEHSAAHGSFSIERRYPAKPQRVFAAWASHAAKDRWFGTGDDFLAPTERYTLDFRVGGREQLEGKLPDGRSFGYDAVYHDIVEDRRIVCSYDVRIDGRRTSVSLMTVEVHAAEEGTRLVLTEQGAFLDGLDSNDQREEGATDSLEQLGAYLNSVADASA
jgi:uncharacterized protein YndB with AHSA1/START domain